MRSYIYLYSAKNLEEAIETLSNTTKEQYEGLLGKVTTHTWDFGIENVLEYHKSIEQLRLLNGLKERIDEAVGNGADELDARERLLVAFIDDLHRSILRMPSHGSNEAYHMAEMAIYEARLEVYDKVSGDIVLGVTKERLVQKDAEMIREGRVHRALEALDERVARGRERNDKNEKVSWQRVKKVIEPLFDEDHSIIDVDLVTGVEGRWESTNNLVRLHGRGGGKKGRAEAVIYTSWYGDRPEDIDDYQAQNRYDFQMGVNRLQPIIQALDEAGFAFRTNFDKLDDETKYLSWSDKPMVTVTGFKYGDEEVARERERIQNATGADALALALL